MIKDLIRASRSYRSFDRSVKVSRFDLLDMIDCARLSPSSRNLQMLKFCPVTDDKTVLSLRENTKWAGALADLHLPPVGHEPTAFLVICGDQSVIPNAETFKTDAGIAAQSILLCAAEKGFGGCIIASFAPDAFRSILSLPDHIVPMLVIGLGKPDETVEIRALSGENTVYYRENGIHCVPKRDLKDLVI